MKSRRITTAMICVFMSFLLSLVPLSVHVSPVLSTLENSTHINVDVQKNEANANPLAVPAAGAALAALAAELGISEGALIAGLCAIGVGATGLAIYNSDWTDLDNPPAPGWPAWNDLPPAVQDGYDYNDDPRAKNYYDNAVAWWALQCGVIQDDGNGGLEPTPEPENDNSSWQKARNVLIALAAGAGGVALNDALAPLVDNAAASVKDLLFGGSNSNNYLTIPYKANYEISGVNVQFSFVPDMIATSTSSSHTQTTMSGSNCYSYSADTRSNGYTNYFYQTTNPTITFAVNGSQLKSTASVTGAKYTTYYWTNGNVTGPSASSGYVYAYSSIGSTYSLYNGLNLNYGGQYIFPNGESYLNGVFSDGVTLLPDYGQFVDTPDGITQNILNDTDLYNFYNTYTDPGVEDYTRALAIPSYLLDGSGNENAQYSDFVQVLPDENVVEIPTDQPITPPTPQPGDQYQQDFGERVGQLLAQPFDQLFPFCLIGDLRRLCVMLEDAVYGDSGELNAQSIEFINGTETFVIPLDGFGLDDIEIEFDLTPVTVLAGITRPFMTALFITGILVGSFRFFLVRGGE